MSNNQGLWADCGVVEELTEQAAETISGGSTIFSLYNNTDANILYQVDNGPLSVILSGEGFIYSTEGNGLITFDKDIRTGLQAKSYYLNDGVSYEFVPNNLTASNPYDLDLGFA